MRSELARRLAFRLLAGMDGGRLELDEGGRRFAFGDPDAELRAVVEVRDPRAYGWTLRGSAGWGEAYIEGFWEADDPVALTRVLCRNMAALDRWRRRLRFPLRPIQRAAGFVPRNTHRGARRNVAAHYDLGNRLFESFLDETMTYSCAVFAEPDATLAEAQLEKLERVCARLELQPDDHLLEIGGGWGALAIHAASSRGCRVTTTTLSAAQHSYATERVRAAGLGDRVEVRRCDYRDLRGRYDKLASIEMIEAVGWQYFPTYFEQCSRLLADDGAMFLQAIVIDDGAYESEKGAKSFANTHVFPGGCLPSARLIGELGATRTEMRIGWADDITADYPPTLAQWRMRFNEAWPELRALGYDERFRRLWNLYLASSEGGFRERRIRDLQFVLAKPGFAPSSGAEATAGRALVAA